MNGTTTEAAVTVRGAVFFYGSKKNPNMVLDGLNMTVPRGVIYGLLGASGCGKTSLLTCMVGLRSFQSGHISVLGCKPGSPGSGIPGPTVGYMPQDVALLGDFNIKDTMFYFGRIFGMSTSEIKERSKFLAELLELPPQDRFIEKLSGGQQRRVSLAAALLHDPQLLILDEPTVGLDPILRQSIWDYLDKITRLENKTVIITTHYIEEARQADKIGLMRRGKLLAEDTPSRLMQHHACDTLELVFLQLSRVQSLQECETPDTGFGVNKTPVNLPDPSTMAPQYIENHTTVQDDQSLVQTKGKKPRSSRVAIMHSLLKKNTLRLVRNTSHMMYILGFPLLQVSIFFLAVGFQPRNLTLAVVNQEVPYDVLVGGCETIPGCNTTRLSCLYLHHLSSELIKQVPYDDVDKAEREFRAGRVRGVLHFGSNFSSALHERHELGRETRDEVVDQGILNVSIDETNTHVSYALKNKIYQAYRNFLGNYFEDCDLDPKIGKLPIDFQLPIYGNENPTYVEFMAPGIILNIIFFVINGVTCTIMLSEVLEGIWNRTLVTGVTTGEVMMSHIITQIVVMIVQTAECLLLSFLAFSLANIGSWSLVISLSLLEGFCGLVFGILISITCKSTTAAIQLTLGSVIPNILLCGAMWPVQGMPKVLRFISEQLPLTSGTESMRNILTKGWGIEKPGVYRGFITVSVWIAFLFIACLICVRNKKG